MTNQALLEYIKIQQRQGASEEQIKNSLVANGWQQSDIAQAMTMLYSNQTPVPQPPLSTTPETTVSSEKSKFYTILSWIYIAVAGLLIVRSLFLLSSLFLLGVPDFSGVFEFLRGMFVINIFPIALLVIGLSLRALASGKKRVTTVIGMTGSVIIFLFLILTFTSPSLFYSLGWYVINFIALLMLFSLVCFFFSLIKNKNTTLAWVVLGTVILYLIMAVAVPVVTSMRNERASEPISLPPLPY